jgi:DNA adenine methylase
MPPSPLACYGAKGRLAPTIVKLFPPHQTYVEPFLGGGSVFFAKPPSPVEVVNDVHGDLVNFFRVLRDGVQRDRLIELVEGTPWSREEFCDALAARKAGRWKDDAERAWLFLVATRQARNGVGRRPSDWSCTVGKTTGGASSRTSMWMRLPERLAAAGLRLQAAQIECGSSQAVLDRYESENTLVYCDPPYLHSTRCKKGRNSYDHEMTEVDHARLLLRLREYKGKVVLSGYASALYDEMLAYWHRIEINTVSSASTKKNKQDARRTEVLWLNYTPAVASAA